MKTKIATFLFKGKSIGSYTQSPEETDSDFFDEVESCKAELTREIYREGKSGGVNIEVIIIEGE